MKQRIIWDRRTKTAQYFWQEQGQVKQADTLPKGKYHYRQQITILLPSEKTEARLLKLPTATEQKTGQMVAMELQNREAMSGFKWQIVQQKENWQWLFCLAHTEQIVQGNGKAQPMDGDFFSVYDGLLAIGRLLGDQLSVAAVLFYWAEEQLTLLFLQDGQPIHGQTLTDVSTATDIAEAYQRTVGALVRQARWQETQKVYGLWEQGSARVMAQQLAVLLSDELVILNDQPPFAQWSQEACPLLVRLLLENGEDKAWYYGNRKISGKQRLAKHKLQLCGALVILMSLVWLGSAILAKDARQQAFDTSPIVVHAPKNDTAYGEILERLAAKQGDAQLREIRLTKDGLELYAEAATWQSAAALGERLQALEEISRLTIVRAEKLQRLQEQVPIDFVTLTIRIELNGGHADER